jgi:hypothetical protein
MTGKGGTEEEMKIIRKINRMQKKRCKKERKGKSKTNETFTNKL